MRLAITQILSGVLIITLSSLVIAWGFPTSFTMTAGQDSGGTDIIKQVFINPGPEYMRAHLFTALVLALGLAVCGVGVIQYIKSRREGMA